MESQRQLARLERWILLARRFELREWGDKWFYRNSFCCVYDRPRSASTTSAHITSLKPDKQLLIVGRTLFGLMFRVVLCLLTAIEDRLASFLVLFGLRFHSLGSSQCNPRLTVILASYLTSCFRVILSYSHILRTSPSRLRKLRCSLLSESCTYSH